MKHSRIFSRLEGKIMRLSTLLSTAEVAVAAEAVEISPSLLAEIEKTEAAPSRSWVKDEDVETHTDVDVSADGDMLWEGLI
jgi:hypothetical protein